MIIDETDDGVWVIHVAENICLGIVKQLLNNRALSQLI